jgi:hypothetical protein
MIWKKRFLLAALTLMVLLMFSHPFVEAQCSMCRTALTGSAEGRELAQGFNRGIMFLAFVPFLIAGTLALLIFQSTRQDTARTSMRAVPTTSHQAVSLGPQLSWSRLSGSSSATTRKIMAPAAKPSPAGSNLWKKDTKMTAGMAAMGWGTLDRTE